MKRLLLLSSLCASTSFAQITLNESNFPIANEDFILSTTTDPQIDFATTGANYTWDFSSLVSQGQRTYSTLPLSQAGTLSQLFFGVFAQAPYKADYFASTTDIPLAQITSFLPITIEDMTLFTNNTSIAINSIGYELSINGQGVAIKSDTIETRHALPLTYGDNYESRGYTSLDMNPIYDAKWNQHRHRISQVDGWGSITTPFGTFDALRIHHTIEEMDSLYITAFGISTWIPLSIPEAHEYEWRSTSDKEAILRIKTNVILGNETVTAIEYRDQFLALDENQAIEVTVGPNPTIDVLHVSTKEMVKEYLIIDSKGQILVRNTSNGSSFDVNTAAFSAGHYNIVVLTQSGVSSAKFIKQ
jgi:hypothetical protein